jgi:membrane-bound lytic murein transglycosylase D
MADHRRGWTRLALAGMLLGGMVTSCTMLKPALRAPDEIELPAISDSLAGVDNLHQLHERYRQSLALAGQRREGEALDSLRSLMFDLRAPAMSEDSAHWALQLDVVRQMAHLLEKRGPDPDQGDGYRSVDFQVQLLSDSLDAYAQAPDSLLESVLAQEPDPDTDSLLAEVIQSPDSLAIRHLALSEIPDADRAEVDHMVDYFVSGRGRKYYQIWLDRYPEVAPTIRRVLEEEGMPADLIFLAMIESGFRISATSKAKARGPWQFIKGTADLFDLRVDYWMDERLDLERSTRAACRFLRKLYNRYDDWHLAMAAYNWGPGNIDKAVKRGATSYWNISRMPSETRNYVPTYLAARRVFLEAERHGFVVQEGTDPDLDLLRVDGCIRISKLADLFQLSEDQLKSHNLHLLQGSTPPDGGHIYVPAASSQQCRDLLAELPSSAFQDWIRHTVRRGETITGIANRYGVSAAELRSVNKLSRKSRLKSGRQLLIPLTGQEREERAEVKSVAKPRKSHAALRADGLPVHKVRRGEVLDRIARKHGVSVAKLMDWNQIKRADRIYPGQELLLADPDSVERVDDQNEQLAEAARTGVEKAARSEDNLREERRERPAKETVRGSKSPTRNHVVRAGETAGAIAARYGVSIKQLAQANGLDRRARIYTGQRLRIPGRSDGAPSGQRQMVHVVRNGESLWALARQYKVKVSDLKRWNQLHGNEIHAGSRLVIILSEEG